MRHRAHFGERLAHEQPARARLDSNVDVLAGEPLGPPTNGVGGRVNAAAVDLARLIVESVESNLRSVHVKPGYDRHRGLLYSSAVIDSRESLALSEGGP